MKKMLSVLAAVIMAFAVVGTTSAAFAATVESPGATTVAPTQEPSTSVQQDDSAESPDTGAIALSGAAAAFVLSGASLAAVLKKKNG